MQKHTKLLAHIAPEKAAAVAVEQEKLRHSKHNAMQKKLMDTYGDHYDSGILNRAARITDESIRKPTWKSAAKKQPCTDKEER